MTSPLPIPGGLLNKEIIDLAYTVLGVSDAMFGRTDEEYASAMTMLRAMMGEWPFDQLGFDTGDARVGSESGIEAKWLTVCGYALALRIGPAIGKTLAPNAQGVHNRAYSALCAAYAVPGQSAWSPGTARGQGHRVGWGDGGTYFARGE